MFLNRKPILMAKGSEELKYFKYKFCHYGWVLDVRLRSYTDLTKKQFDYFLDYGYSTDKINKFELTGKF